MDYWLRFKDKSIERNYQHYFIRNNIKQYKTIKYVLLIYLLTNLFSTIMQYFFSNNQRYKTNIWIIRKILTIIIGVLIIFRIYFKSDKYGTNELKKFDIIKFAAGIIFQVLYDDDFIMNFEQNYINTSDEVFYQAYQIQLTTLLICLIFHRWTFRILYFICSSCYFSIIKTQINPQFIEQIGFIIIFGIVVYYIEKLSRDNYYEFHYILEKEKVWKGLLDHLPEDIVIIDNKGDVRYKNVTFFGENTAPENFTKWITDKKTNLPFVAKVTNMLLRDSSNDLRAKFEELTLLSKIKMNMIIENSEKAPIKKGDINEYSSIASKSIIDKLKKRPRTLSRVTKILNPHINLFLEHNLYLIFDGIYRGKSVEIRVVSTLFEGEKCLMMLFFDTTQRDLIAKLEQNDLYKNIVLSTVSHELRNPLNSSISMINLAVEDQQVPLKIREEILQPSLRSLGMLTNLINDILDYSQIQANTLKLVFQPTNLRQLIYDSCILIDTQCQRKELKLRVHIDSDIPEIINTDPNRLTQVLLNLLSNALKFTLTGYIRIVIKVVESDQDLILISVQDTGIGIKSEDISRLFQEYGKLDLGKNATINPTGCGLGLNISQKLAKRLGDDNSKGIEVKSEINQGTTFWFIIKNKTDFFADETKIISKKDSKRTKTVHYSDSSTKFYEKFNKCTMNEEDFNLCIDEGDKENAEKYNTNRNFILSSFKPLEIISTGMINEVSEPFENLDVDIRLIAIYNNDSLNSIYSNLIRLDIDFVIGKNIQDIKMKLIEEKKRFNMILIDNTISVIETINLINTLKKKIEAKEIAKIPIVICFDLMDKELEKKYLELGVYDLIQKPISKNKLIDIYKRFILYSSV